MTEYQATYKSDAAMTAAARAAKARRQAVLGRVRAQRAIAYKRTVADWMREGLLVWGSELKNKALRRQCPVS